MKIPNINKVFAAVINAKIGRTIDPIGGRNAWKSLESNVIYNKNADKSNPAIFVPYYASKLGTMQIYHFDGKK